ncbi:hypothetical protein YC2023_070538 [Brassica napus]
MLIHPTIETQRPPKIQNKYKKWMRILFCAYYISLKRCIDEKKWSRDGNALTQSKNGITARSNNKREEQGENVRRSHRFYVLSLLGAFVESYFSLVVLFRSGYPDHLKLE